MLIITVDCIIFFSLYDFPELLSGIFYVVLKLAFSVFKAMLLDHTSSRLIQLSALILSYHVPLSLMVFTTASILHSAMPAVFHLILSLQRLYNFTLTIIIHLYSSSYKFSTYTIFAFSLPF